MHLTNRKTGMSTHYSRIFDLWRELKRRKVTRVITVYAASAFVILELVSIIVEPLRLPDWTLTLVIVLLFVGLIIAFVLSWIYDVTPEGIEKTKPAHLSESKAMPGSSKGWKIASYISFVVIAGLIALNLIPRSKASEGSGNINASIAVLPFVNRSGEEEDIYFTDGIHDQIISQLFKIGGLSVRGRTSVEVYRSSPKNLRTIGEELNAEYIVEGGVQRVGDQVRINVQLIEAQTDNHLWADVFDRKLSTENILSLQSEIALRIASRLKLALSPEVEARINYQQTDDINALQAYHKGRYFLGKRTQQTIQQAHRYFSEAISIDSTFALAYAGLADAYSQFSGYGILNTLEAIPRALEAAEMALKLDPTLGEAHLSAAWAEFYLLIGKANLHAKFERAIELVPGDANAYHWYAWYLIGRKEFKRAEMLMNKALELDPLSIVINASAGFLYMVSGKNDRAIEQLKSTLELAPAFPRAHFFLGQAYLIKDMNELGIEHIAKAVENSDRNPQYVSTLAFAFGRAGQETEAEQLLKELEEQQSNRNVLNYDLAVASLGVNNTEQAIKYLQSAVVNLDSWLRYIQVDPRFDLIRGNPEFQHVVSEVWP